MFKSKRKIIFVLAFFTFFIMLFSSSNAMTNLDLKDAVWSNRDSIFESFQNIEKKDVKARSPMYITKTIMEMYAGENGYDDAPYTIQWIKVGLLIADFSQKIRIVLFMTKTESFGLSFTAENYFLGRCFNTNI